MNKSILSAFCAQDDLPISEGVIAYFDGLCEPNPGGVACAGYRIEGAHSGNGHVLVGRGAGMTNNVAEYTAALVVLRTLYKHGYRGPVLLRGDSQLVVKQFNGEWDCGAPLLLPLMERLHTAAEYFESLRLEWIPRAENEAADTQSRAAYKLATGHEAPIRGPKAKR